MRYHGRVNLETDRDLLRLVRSAAIRLTISRAGEMGIRAGVALMAACVALAFAGVVFPVSGVPLLQAVGAAAATVIAAGILAAILRPVRLLDAAQVLDLRLRLEERVGTAAEIASAGAARRSSLAARVVADAADRLASVPISAVTPWRIPRTLWWIPALAAALLIWTTWIQGLTIPGTPAHRSTEVIRKEGQRLEQFARSLQSRTRSQHMPATRRLAPQIRDLGVRLQRERLDRAEALAKLSDFSQQLEQTRREIDERLQAARPSTSGQARTPPDLLRRQTVQRQVRQLEELLSRLRQDQPADSADALERLGQITATGEGAQPARVQQQLQQAREQLQQGNIAGAGEAMMNALRELQGLDSLLADSEGIQSAEQRVARSRATLAGGPVEDEPEAGQESAQMAEPRTAAGQNRPTPGEGTDAAEPPQGPNEGTTPGTGRGDEKIGAPTPRLEAERTPQRIRGAQAEGSATTSEIVGVGRRGGSRAQIAPVSPAVVARADRAMTRARTPARYREIVRRYFERLAKLR